MIRGPRLSAQALTPRMRAQEIISNNVANLTTGGFRRERITFHRELERAGGLPWPGIRLETRADDSVAAITPSGNPLDFAIDGPGFFVVETRGGERYTRTGSFELAPDGSLATLSGHAVLGEGGPITLPPGVVSAGDDGTIQINGRPIGTLRLVTIDAADLVREGQNLFSLAEGAASGPPDPNTAVRQAHVETSNVQPVIELVEMLRVFREYESNYQAMNTAGGTLGRLINLQMR